MSVTVPVVAIGGVDASNARRLHPRGRRGRRGDQGGDGPGASGGGRCGSLSSASSGSSGSSSSAGSRTGSATTRRSSPDGLVVTQDALVEDVHFRLDWTSWRDLGYKAAAVNVSDLAASGARPFALVVSLGAPPETRARGRARAVRGAQRGGGRDRRRRHDAGRAALPERDRARALGARARPGGGACPATCSS